MPFGSSKSGAVDAADQPQLDRPMHSIRLDQKCHKEMRPCISMFCALSSERDGIGEEILPFSRATCDCGVRIGIVRDAGSLPRVHCWLDTPAGPGGGGSSAGGLGGLALLPQPPSPLASSSVALGPPSRGPLLSSLDETRAGRYASRDGQRRLPMTPGLLGPV